LKSCCIFGAVSPPHSPQFSVPSSPSIGSCHGAGEQSRASHQNGPVLIPGQFMCDLRWRRWRWEGFFYEYLRFFLYHHTSAAYSFTHLSPTPILAIGRAIKYMYEYAPHKDVSVNDGPYIRRWSRNSII